MKDSNQTIDRVIFDLPKGLIGWINLKDYKNALYVGDPSDALYEEILEHIPNAQCVSELTDEEMPERTYDLVISTPILEKTEGISNCFRILYTYLSENGRLLLAMHNRMGLRYFCGDRDPYTDRNFDGVENYRRAYSKEEDIFSGRAYSMGELRKLIADVGADPRHIKFYSVYPGLENPAFLFAEDYVPNEDLSNRIQPIYHYPHTIFLEEEGLYNGLVKNGMFHSMANAYLIEVTRHADLLPVEHVTSSLERGREDALYTVIRSDDSVVKRAAYPEGDDRLRNLSQNIERLKSRGIPAIEGKLCENDCGRVSYEMPRIYAPTGQLYLRMVAENDVEEFVKLLDHFRDLIMCSSEEATAEEIEDWKVRYREECEEKRRQDALHKGREYKVQEIQNDFFDFDLGPVFRQGFIDMIPLNSFYIDREFRFYDQEFCLDVYPAKAVLYRMVITLFSRSVELNRYISMEDLLKRYDLYRDLAKWSDLQFHWLDPLLNYAELSDYHKTQYRDSLTVSTNRQRMNYSQEDYQRIFVNLFEHAKSRKLILFGSGAYARKFLKLYGRDYPVSFVVDNSESKWGQHFEGLEIRSPESLRVLSPGEYKVIVCIKNYPSVMKQLIEMGVTSYSIYDAGMSYERPREPITTTTDTGSKETKKYHVGYVAGVFDLFHIGHLNLFKRAKEYCDYLIVGVVSDEGVRENKKANPVIPFAERIEIVRSCRYVDEAVEIPNGFHDTEEAYKLYHFDVQFSGSDYENDQRWLAKQQYLRERGSDLVFFPYTQSTSSTKLKGVINQRLEKTK